MRVPRMLRSGPRVGDGETFVSDIVDQATVPAAKMIVGFGRLGRDEALVSR
jgi:hypothetical protein